MDRSDVLTLITETFTSNTFGAQVKTETRHDVYCNVSSVTRTEWADGGRLGLNPEYRFTMFFFDYSGQEICEYKGIRYTIYRTYRAQDDTIELYAERRQGNG